MSHSRLLTSAESLPQIQIQRDLAYAVVIHPALPSNLGNYLVVIHEQATKALLESSRVMESTTCASLLAIYSLARIVVYF